MSGGKILEQVEIDLRNQASQEIKTIYIDIFNNSLSRKWLAAFNNLLENNYHLEKNYCFFGFINHQRNGSFLLDRVNHSINAINRADIGYHIDDYFDMGNTLSDDPKHGRYPEIGFDKDRNIIHDKFNNLHRYFEDLQGVSGSMSPYYEKADPETRWHIRQLNLLCHEFESWALSYRNEIRAPEWQRHSQLMCWLQSPRFVLDQTDYELFGIETINRPMGGVFVGVNKAVGKHHWEVFIDEGRDSRLDELTTTTLKSQTEAAGDFDIEWSQNPATHIWQQRRLTEFHKWLIDNGFDPDDKSLTIGHPQIGQVDLMRSFGSEYYQDIWAILNNYLDVYRVKTSNNIAVYDYCWSDSDYMQKQIAILK